jgi:hypothetical protein
MAATKTQSLDLNKNSLYTHKAVFFSFLFGTKQEKKNPLQNKENQGRQTKTGSTPQPSQPTT